MAVKSTHVIALAGFILGAFGLGSLLSGDSSAADPEARGTRSHVAATGDRASRPFGEPGRSEEQTTGEAPSTGELPLAARSNEPGHEAAQPAEEMSLTLLLSRAAELQGRVSGNEAELNELCLELRRRVEILGAAELERRFLSLSEPQFHTLCWLLNQRWKEWTLGIHGDQVAWGQILDMHSVERWPGELHTFMLNAVAGAYGASPQRGALEFVRWCSDCPADVYQYALALVDSPEEELRDIGNDLLVAVVTGEKAPAVFGTSATPWLGAIALDDGRQLRSRMTSLRILARIDTAATRDVLVTALSSNLPEDRRVAGHALSAIGFDRTRSSPRSPSVLDENLSKLVATSYPQEDDAWRRLAITATILLSSTLPADLERLASLEPNEEVRQALHAMRESALAGASPGTLLDVVAERVPCDGCP